ncbi:TEL2-interacting protein 1 [Phytophthora pseudosyringae]|uniref:TEL2-interacting protein 1 n=1 Tax=Phytophthora pseudosyringae TaxID=221518 RepID=A0A8T1VX75_9STRA|nr:TEL2-interacting protein 1 [Phytophthora pseudosyringae]
MATAEVAAYVELCTRLSRFVQLQPSDGLCKELQEVLDELVGLYGRVEVSPAPEKRAVDAHLVGFAAMDDLVLLSLHKLLGSFVLHSQSSALQERSFAVFARVLRRCKPRMRGYNPGHVQRRLSFVQSCVLYLPPPPEAGEDGEDVPGAATLAAQPEELRLAILLSLRGLLEEEEQEKQALLLQVDQQHFFAYLVASLLHVAQRDRCREAALQAVEVLKCVLFFIRDPHTLRQYLPGVAAGLWKSANAPQQASKVIVAALECLATALHLCIGDDHLPGDGEGGVKQEQQRFTLEAIRQSVEAKKEGTAEANEPVEAPSSEGDTWLETTAVNLDLLLSRMFAASATAVAAGTTSTGLPRSSWRVRSALAQLCGTVMLQCRQALRMSFFRCYDELLVLRGDAIAEVTHEADKVLQKLQMSALSSEERFRVLPEMADRFQMLLSTLVLKVATEHEATKVHLVRTLRGYLAFLGSSLTPYLDASMESICTSLCRVVSYAALDTQLIVHQTLPSLPESDESDGTSVASVVVSQFQKRLRFFNEEASVREVLSMLRDVGAVSTPAGFIDCAFTLLSEAGSRSTETGNAEVVLVLNEFLRAYCPNKESSTHSVHESVDVHLVGRVLEDLLALEAWEERNGSTRALVSQRALMVECVGVCAEILGAEFKLFLLHVLYPLVEQLGSHSVEVERAALAALEKVYFFTGYESLEALFQANMDYFVDSLCARLEQLDAYPMTAFVVEALLRHTQLASLPLVDEVASSLLRSVDLYQDSPHVGGLLRALKNLLDSIVRDAQESQAKKVSTVGDDETEKSATSRSLLDNFIHEMKVLANDGIDALDIEAETDDEEKHSSPEAPEPPSVKGAMPMEYDEVQPDSQDAGEDKDEDASGYRSLVVDIMDRCGYFLVESDPIACCLVLSLINEGVRFLSQHQKQLLPLVARMWPELLPRLRVENRAIVTGTVRVISTLAETAGDFVGDRFVESVWPVLRSQVQSIHFGADAKSSQLTRSMLLISKPEDGTEVQTSQPGAETQAPADSELGAVSGTRKTQEIRQLLAILSCLTMVCQQSETVTQLVPEITRACSKFLSPTAPREVVEQTSELFAALVQRNGEEVFCTVAALADWVPPTPPSARFSRYEPDAVRRFYRGHLSGLSGQTKSCRDNASILMDRLFR